MDKQFLLRAATARAINVWKKLQNCGYIRIGNMPIITINARLKTTAGYCYHTERRIELSHELFSEYYDGFIFDTIPHELCHQVDWDYNRIAKHGPTWKHIMRSIGCEPSTYHSYTNSSTKQKKLLESKHEPIN